MSTLSDEDIRGIADLAQLKLTDDEVTNFRGDLEGVLSYFDKLQEVDTEGVEEIGHITGLENVYRKDEAEEISREQRDAIMAEVPRTEGDSIAVKSIL